MPHQCKICGGGVTPRHTIENITYYHCAACDFLQNYYWEDQPNSSQQQLVINAEARADRWPAGKADDMYQQGWEFLGMMASPIVWRSRRLHRLLLHLPGYFALTKYFLKRKFHRILDFGCGYGITVLKLRRRDKLDAYGLDPFSPNRDPSILRVHLHEANFPDQSFDGIFSIETMEHIDNVLETFRELYRILKPNGVLLIQTRRLEDKNYTRDQDKWFYLKDPKTHVSIYSEPAFHEIARRIGFRSVEFCNDRIARFHK